MATAAVASPVDALADQAVDLLGSSSEFYTTRTIPIPGATKTEANDYVFSLQSEPFHQLKKYLVSGIKLPKDATIFKQDYPKELLEPYTMRSSDQFYGKMVTVLTTIQKHCYDFQKGTMNDAVKLSGSIADFAETATKASVTLTACFEVIKVPGVKSSDPAVVDAFANFSSTITSLKSAATSARDECKVVFAGIGQFKTDTARDKIEEDAIDKIADAVLPKTADLDNKMKADMDAAYKLLQQVVKGHNQAMDSQNRRRSESWRFH